MGFISASLFPARKWEEVIQGGTRGITPHCREPREQYCQWLWGEGRPEAQSRYIHRPYYIASRSSPPICHLHLLSSIPWPHPYLHPSHCSFHMMPYICLILFCPSANDTIFLLLSFSPGTSKAPVTLALNLFPIHPFRSLSMHNLYPLPTLSIILSKSFQNLSLSLPSLSLKT